MASASVEALQLGSSSYNFQGFKKCTDGTPYGFCSMNKPLMCSNGKLVNSSFCGAKTTKAVSAPVKVAPASVKVAPAPVKVAPVTPQPVTQIDSQLLEKRVHELINMERQKQGLSPVQLNEVISSAARLHSNDMAQRNYFSHVSPEGNDFQWRYGQVGFTCSVQQGNLIYKGAENIYQNWVGSTYYSNGTPATFNNVETLAQATVKAWMNSPGHRQNILTSHWGRQGIGVGISSQGKVYVTENFC